MFCDTHVIVGGGKTGLANRSLEICLSVDFESLSMEIESQQRTKDELTKALSAKTEERTEIAIQLTDVRWKKDLSGFLDDIIKGRQHCSLAFRVRDYRLTVYLRNEKSGRSRIEIALPLWM